MSKPLRVVVVVFVAMVLFTALAYLIKVPLLLLAAAFVTPQSAAATTAEGIVALVAMASSVTGTWWACQRLWRGLADVGEDAE